MPKIKEDINKILHKDRLIIDNTLPYVNKI